MNSRDQSKLRELLLKLAQERTRPESSSVPDDHDIEQLLKLRFETDARTTSEISDRVQSRLSKILADRESSPARELELPLNIAQTSHPKPFMRQRYTWATLGAAAATLLLIWLIFAPKHTNSAIGRFTAVAGRPRISLLGTTASELAVTDGSIPLGSQIRTGNGENADIT